MSLTIGTIHTKILQKFKAIRTSISSLYTICDSEGAKLIRIVEDEFENISKDYSLSTMSIMITPVPDSGEYIQIISSNNYVAKADEITSELKTLIGVIFCQYEHIINAAQRNGGDIAIAMSGGGKGSCKGSGKAAAKASGAKANSTNAKPILSIDTKHEIEEIIRQLSIADSIVIEQQLKRTDYEVCDCGEKMIIAPSSSELFCPNDECGEIRVLYGTVFEDHQFYNQDGQKTKHGSYTHMRHLKFWIERIQAKENKEFSAIQHAKLDHCIARDGMITNEINCTVMRDYLKECKITILNNHAPLLVRIKTGKVPPQLTYNETNELSIKFSRMMELYDCLNPEETFGRQNKPYYPYFIYKILEDMFQKTPKIRILECIHLQSRETVIENDLIYEKVCEASDGKFIFKPTDRSEYI